MSFQAQLMYMIGWVIRRPESLITHSTDFRRDLDMDDTDVELMVFKLETYFNKELTTDQVRGIRTVQDVGRLLR